MKKGKLTKIITVITILCALISITSAFFSFILPWYLSRRITSIANETDVSKIIGKADGPTAIFISSTCSPFSHSVTVIFAILAISGVIYLINAKMGDKRS